MNKKLLGAIGALAILTGGAFALQFADASSVMHNVIAKHLEGSWRLNAELTARIDPLWTGDLPKAIQFVRNDKILSQLQEAYPRFKDTTIFMSGTATMNDEQHLFIVLNQKGNSELVLFTPSRISPMGEPHYMLVSMACSRDPWRDLLILGGDEKTQSAAVYDRAK